MIAKLLKHFCSVVFVDISLQTRTWSPTTQQPDCLCQWNCARLSSNMRQRGEPSFSSILTKMIAKLLKNLCFVVVCWHFTLPRTAWYCVPPHTMWYHLSPHTAYYHMSPHTLWYHVSPHTMWWENISRVTLLSENEHSTQINSPNVLHASSLFPPSFLSCSIIPLLQHNKYTSFILQ